MKIICSFGLLVTLLLVAFVLGIVVGAGVMAPAQPAQPAAAVSLTG